MEALRTHSPGVHAPPATAGRAHPPPQTVQSHDILYTLSRNILYTPARA
jgi:hypothetical protein